MKLCPLSKEGEAVFAELLKKRQTESASSPDFKLLTTLRYDPDLKHLTRRIPIAMEDSDDDVFFLSKLHHQRLKYSAKILGWDIRVSHTEMVAKMTAAVNNSEKPLRVRVTVDRQGVMECQVNEISPRDNLFSGLSVTPKKDDIDPVFDVVLDTGRVEADVTNMVKTTERTLYDSIRNRNGASVTPVNNPREVILVGTQGQLLEGSMTSIAILSENGEWITPKLTSGGMIGVTRSFLLELGFVKEGTVYAKDLNDGDKVLLSNGVQGVCTGILRIHKSPQ